MFSSNKKRTRNKNFLIKIKPSRATRRALLVRLSARLKTRAALVAVVLLVLFAGLVYYLFVSDNFVITEVQIEGVNENLAQQIESHYSNISSSKKWLIFKQDTIFLFPKADFTESLRYAVPKVKDTQTQTEPPHLLTITATERSQKGIWCNYSSGQQNTACYFYDTEGVIYAPAPNSSRGFLIAPIRDKRNQEPQLGDTVLSKQDMEYADMLAQALELAHKKPFYISFEAQDEVRAGFSLGGGQEWEVYFSRTNDVIESVENLILVLEEEIKSPALLEYIDLRLGNKVFYKYVDE